MFGYMKYLLIESNEDVKEMISVGKRVFFEKHRYFERQIFTRFVIMKGIKKVIVEIYYLSVNLIFCRIILISDALINRMIVS